MKFSARRIGEKNREIEGQSGLELGPEVLWDGLELARSLWMG
jgi:hypothetical protein